MEPSDKEQPYVEVYCKAEQIVIAKLPMIGGSLISREYIRNHIEFQRLGFNFMHSANFTNGSVVLCLKCGNPLYIKDAGKAALKDAKGKVQGEVPLTLGTMSFTG